MKRSDATAVDKLSMSLDDLVAQNTRPKVIRTSRDTKEPRRGGVTKVERRLGPTRVTPATRQPRKEEPTRERRPPARRSVRAGSPRNRRCVEIELASAYTPERMLVCASAYDGVRRWLRVPQIRMHLVNFHCMMFNVDPETPQARW